MSEAKKKMSLIEWIRNRIGDSALYGGKTVCDSPQNAQTMRHFDSQFIISRPKEAESPSDAVIKRRTQVRRDNLRTPFDNSTFWGTLTPKNVNVIAGIIKNAIGKNKAINTLWGIENCGQFSMNAGIKRAALKTKANTFGGTLNVSTHQASLNSSLWGMICTQIATANLLKNVQFILSHPEEAESRREDLGTSVPFMERLITALACGDAHALRAQHDNAWKIINTTKFMNITINGGYHA